MLYAERMIQERLMSITSLSLETKIRKLYGDGSKGYVFEVAKEKIDEINQQNHTGRT